MTGETTTLLPSPALDHIIERPRLIALIEDGEPRVVLLAAPAGYGKTTLARQWCARQTGPVAWYRTTRASGDVAALSVALDELLNRVVPQPGRDPKRIAAIAAVNARPLPLARALVSTYASLGREVLLVLDEWEMAGTKEADELVAHVVDELDIRVLVTSRTRPPWFTPRLTVYGEGREIGMDALAMTDEEALTVLARQAEAPDRILLQRARGWPVILGLAAMTPNVPEGRLVPRLLHDFLASELLQSTSRGVQWGLGLIAAASVGDLAVARLILGRTTDHVLNNAARLGLVTIDADDGVSLHPLLAELLLDRIRRMEPATRRRMTKQLEALIESERWDEALAVAESIPDAAFVSRALQGALDELLHAGRLATLQRWVAASQAAGGDGPLTQYVASEIAARLGQYSRAELIADRAARGLEGDLAARAHLVAARAAYLAERSHQSRKHAHAARQLSQQPATHAAALWATFAEAVDDEREEAEGILSAFRDIDLHTIEHAIRLAQGSLLIGALSGDLDGRLREAEAVSSVLDSSLDPLVHTSFLNAYAHALVNSADYERALDIALQEDAVAKHHGLEFAYRFAAINQARAMIGLRRFPLAERSLGRLRRELISTPDDYQAVQIAIQTASLYLSLGDAGRAHAALTGPPLSRLGKAINGERLAMRALACAALGDSRGALKDATAAIGTSALLEVRALSATATAIAALTNEDAKSAAAAVREALDAEIPHAVVLGLRSHPSLTAHVLEADGPERLAALLSSSKDTALARQAGVQLPRSKLRSEALSPRELEIHGLLAEGLTNQEISKLLFISQSTTKVHVRHILEKLGVRSRVEAVRIWQEPPEDVINAPR